MTPTQEAGPVAVNSSVLAQVSYSAGQSVLQLWFCNGAIYRYFAVPAGICDNLLAAQSKGTYFHREIRDRFRYILIRRPQ
jgi:KTSC domain